jgi:hypothetical protein
MIRLALLIVPLLLAACEALPRDESNRAPSADYRTGSNIPQRDRAQKIESYSVDPSQAPRPVNPASRTGG